MPLDGARLIVAPVSESPSARERAAGWLADFVLGKFTRLYAAILLGAAGLALSFAWSVGPQQALDARQYARLTASAQGRIVDRWLAIEWKASQAGLPDWRNAARATPCVVLDYDGDWGSHRRAFCGTRLPFYPHYDPIGHDRLAPGVPFDWARDAHGLVVPELRMPGSLKAHLEKTAAVERPFPNIRDARNGLELLQFELVDPVESAVRGWSAAPASVALAVDPTDAGIAVPRAYIEQRARKSADWVSAAIAGFVGLVTWFAAAPLLLGHVPGLARHLLTILPLLALPWWGDELPRQLARLSEDVAQVIEDMGAIVAHGALRATAPAEALLAHGERLAWPPAGAPYESTFGRLRLAAPQRPFASPDAALAALADTAASQVRAWPAAERAALFRALEAQKKRGLYGAGYAFLRAARDGAVDPDPEVRDAARSFLSEWLTQPVLDPQPGSPAFAERLRLHRELQQVPVPVIANLASFSVERAERAAAQKR